MKNEFKIGTYQPIKNSKAHAPILEELPPAMDLTPIIEPEPIVIKEDIYTESEPDVDTVVEIAPGFTEISKEQVYGILPSAEIGSVIFIHDAAFIIDSDTETSFILLATEIEDIEEIESITEEIEEIPYNLTHEPVRSGIPALMPIKPVDIDILPPQVNDDLLRETLSQKLMDLYGRLCIYTYTKKGHEYNVLLDTFESCCISEKELTKV